VITGGVRQVMVISVPAPLPYPQGARSQNIGGIELISSQITEPTGTIQLVSALADHCTKRGFYPATVLGFFVSGQGTYIKNQILLCALYVLKEKVAGAKRTSRLHLPLSTGFIAHLSLLPKMTWSLRNSVQIIRDAPFQ